MLEVLIVSNDGRTGALPDLPMLRATRGLAAEAAWLVTRRDFDAVIWFADELNHHWLAECRLVHEAVPSCPIVVVYKSFANVTVSDLVVAGVDQVISEHHTSAARLIERATVASETNRRRARPSMVRPASDNGSDGEASEAEMAELILATKHAALQERYQAPRTSFLLQVEDDPAYVKWVADALSPEEFQIVNVDDLATAEVAVRERPFDAVLVDLTLADACRSESVGRLAAMAPEAMVIAVSSLTDETLMQECLHAGAQDFHLKAQLQPQMLANFLRLGIARKVAENAVRRQAVGNVGEVGRFEFRDRSRYVVTRSLCVIPVRADLSPDGSIFVDGFSCDISREGIGFEVPGDFRLPTRQLLVGMEDPHGQLAFATLVVRSVKTLDGRLRIGATFADPERDMLADDNLLPALDPNHWRFRCRIPEVGLQKWCQLGVLQPYTFDKVLVCPFCAAAVTFRDACRACGSIDITAERMIHHFACAHVNHATEFDAGDSLNCPKCRSKHLIVGADFEYVDGPLRCNECGWSDTELAVVGRCLQCRQSFPMHNAVEEKLIGYTARRLEPLAFVDLN